MFSSHPIREPFLDVIELCVNSNEEYRLMTRTNHLIDQIDIWLELDRHSSLSGH